MATGTMVATHWSATERRSRDEITKAFTVKNKSQWLIGDLLLNIQGEEFDDREFDQKLRDIADENRVTVGTIRTYRMVAGAYPATMERPNFTVARDLVRAVDAVNKTSGKSLDAPTEYEKMKAAGEKVTVDSIASKFGRQVASRPATDTPENTIRSISKLMYKLHGKKLTKSDRTQLLTIRLSIDVLLES